MTARSALHAVLQPLLPKTWNILPYRPTKSAIDKPQVWMMQTRVERNTAARNAADDTTVALVLVQPTLAPGKADDALEADLDTLLDALDRLEGADWESADRDVADDAYPCYLITVRILTTRKDA